MNRYINKISSLQIFQIIRFASLFLIGVVFAKSTLTTQEIGNYETLIMISGAVSFFWISGIIQTFLPLYKNNKSLKNSHNSSKIAIFNLFILITFFSILVALIVFFARDSFVNLVNQPSQLNYFDIFIWYILLNNPTFIIEYILLLKNKNKQIIFYGLVSYFLQFLFVVIPVLLNFGLVYSIIGLIAISIIRICLLIILLFKYSVFQISFSFIKEHLKLATPLILSLIISGSAQYIDSLIITSKFNADKFAIFRYGARELPFVVLLATAFSNAMLTEFNEGFNLSEVLKKIKKYSSKLMHFLFPLTFILLVTSKWFYPILFNINFSESYKVFNVYLLLIISRLVFPQTILVGLKYTKIIFWVSSFELLINIILSLILINYFGISGVAIATVIAYFFEKIILISISYFKLKILPKHYISIPLLLIYSIITLILYYLF